jgi:hypothetical protein
MTSVAERVASLEAALWGRDGRGGIVDEIDEIKDKLDQLLFRAALAGWALAGATIALVADVVSHAL